MKRILAIFFLLASFSILAQQPIMRNAMSTNIAGTPVLSFTNLTVTNVNSGTNWIFGAATTNTVARLMDIYNYISVTGGITATMGSNIVSGYGSDLFILRTNGYGTNTILVNPHFTNAINHGNAFSSPNAGEDIGVSQTEQFGSGAVANNDGATAVGNFAHSLGVQATSVGAGAIGGGAYSVSIGSSTLSSSNASVAVGFGALAEHGESIAIGFNSFGTGTNSVAIGPFARTRNTADKAIAIGVSALASNIESVAIGAHSLAGMRGDTIVGFSSYSTRDDATVLGANSTASEDGIVVGQSSQSGTNAIAIGGGSVSTGSNSVSIGNGIVNTTDDSFVLGLDNHAVSIPGFFEIPRNAGLNRVWSCTNATTGRGTWVALAPAPPSPPTDYVTNNNGWGTNMVDWGTNFTSMSNLNVGGSLYVSNGVWITNIDNLAQLLYVNSRSTNLSAYLGTNVFINGGDGDVNGSGSISVADVSLVNGYLNGSVALSSDQYARANISGDSLVSGTDAFYLQQVSLGAMTIENAKYFMRRMRGRAMSVDTNGQTRFGFVSAGYNIPFLGIVEILSSKTTNAPALFVINTNKFFVDTNGWVGIGTNLPQAALHVYSNSIFDGSVQLGWVTGSKLAEFDANRLLTNSAYSATELTNPLATINYTDTKQYGSANLTNWSGIATSAVLYPWGGQWGSTTLSNLAATGALTNANEVQYGCANLTNWCQISTNDFISGTTVSNAISAQTYGQVWYIWGSSNVTSVTNYLGTNYKAMQKSDVTLSTTANTNVYVNPALNDYIGEVITAIPAGISSITPGDITSISYAYISGGGSMSLLAEVYIRTNLLAYTNSNEREIGVGPTFALSTSLAAYQTAIPITTNVSLSVTNYLVRKLKVVSKSGTPNVSLVSQGAYPARVTFPIGSASFVLKSGDTMSGSLVMNSGQFIGNGAGLTNIPFSAITNRNTYSTNAALNGATINLDGGMYQRTNAAGAITFTGLSGVENDKAKGVTLFIETITAGADVTVTIPASWRNHNVATALYVTNGWTGILSVQAYGSYMTNCAFLLVK